jgi:hypothetical protein
MLPCSEYLPRALTLFKAALQKWREINMAVQLLLQQKGPLPIKVTFNSLTNGPVYLQVDGSVWTQTANKMIGIAIQIDGNQVGVAQIFSNTASTHRAVVPAFIALKLDQGQHTLSLLAQDATTTSDLNDFFTAVIHY